MRFQITRYTTRISVQIDPFNEDPFRSWIEVSRSRWPVLHATEINQYDAWTPATISWNVSSGQVDPKKAQVFARALDYAAIIAAYLDIDIDSIRLNGKSIMVGEKVLDM